MRQSKFWKWSTLALLVALIIVIYLNGFPSINERSKEKTAERAVAFINENLLAGFATASLTSVKEIDGLYLLDIDLVSNLSGESQNATLYVTKDGKLLFPSAIDISSFKYAAPVEEGTEDVSLEAADDPILGNPEAVLTIVEYSDFECPFCGEVYWTVKLVLEEYPEDVQFVYKNFLIESHTFAQKAAEAAECANLQGKFLAYHDILFQNQDALGIDDLKKYAADVGLDTELFTRCLDSGAMAEEVALDMSEGLQEGVSGTPTFFIGEQKIEGNQKFAAFQTIIEEELAKMRQETNSSS